MTSGLVGLDALSSNGHALFWLESRPQEGGRVVLVILEDGHTRDLTPPPWNVRSRVHEYGGGAYLVTADSAFFVDFTTQDIHRVDLGDGSVFRLTELPDTRFADFCMDEARRRLIMVAERHGTAEPENLLVSVDLESGRMEPLHRGHDFYAAPRLSPDGTRLAFLTWDHPNMPWDGTQLHVARVDDEGELVDVTVVAGGADESIVEPLWQSEHRLVFASDRSGHWNLHGFDASGVYRIHADEAEYSEPHWTFAPKSFAVLSPHHLICRRIADGEHSLVVVDADTGFATPWLSDWHTFDALTVHQGRVFTIAGAGAQLPAIIALDAANRAETVIHRSGDLSRLAPYFSRAEHVHYPTRGGAVPGARAHGYFYPPTNPDCVAPANARPPLLVMSHGGPTACASPTLNLRVQYYTSRGWAVLDVNYGGSTGFGRAYRARLDGQWGRVDVTDCEDGVRFLTDTGRADAARVAIRGGSAGGYTTLAALTFADAFRAGASWYGIGDLELLARDTHKFESRYLDRLVGPLPESAAIYRERSPINHLDRFHCGVLFLQGGKDRVVPPNQAETMVEALRRKQLPVAYVNFPEEGHGFRDAVNIRRAVEAEYAFFARLFGFEPADPLPPLEIENLC